MTGPFLALAGCLALTGCAAGLQGDCSNTGIVLSLNPVAATADHTAEPPGNQQQFVSTAAPTAPPGCALPEWILLAHPSWTSSDPVNISISSANDTTNGTAVCKGATNGAATLTATFVFDGTTSKATATLTCK
jgi:hypothetical protein